ncbi:amidohydrolase [Ferviditalea candida]|uniref:Amidohydrolase n=1 Tax=Ferviditalea candida TaxID=3108399 RepID=A0ABU5ZEP9_9BACL|nr:amidohydrolase [Paenibacillaceae bacterium T2]
MDRRDLAGELELMAEQIQPWLLERRREIHRFPEVGWTEFHTSALVAQYLHEMNWKVKVGREIVSEEERLGVPSADKLEEHYAEVRSLLPVNPFIEHMRGGMTGVIGVLDTGRPGPTIAFRFDLDALPVTETEQSGHFPVRHGFSSVRRGQMHACGHDGHTAIGLGLAKLLSSRIAGLSGKIKLIFQPAEEGLRGAYPMVKAGAVDDVDYFFALHLGLRTGQGELITGAVNFLASTKFKISFTGKAAHAGIEPEQGRNAMLAAASAVLGIHGISAHSQGKTRVNCGTLQAGTAANIIPASAELTVETRSDRANVNEYLENRVKEICKGAAAMYGVDADWRIVGKGIPCDSHPELAKLVESAAAAIRSFDKISFGVPFEASDDATYFMDAVHARGGLSTYIVLGTRLAGGHHQPDFDFFEEDLVKGVKLLSRLALNLCGGIRN